MHHQYDHQKKSASNEHNPARMQIGIMGYNATDGMGDVAHMLAAGTLLKSSFPAADIVYQICFNFTRGEETENKNRVLQLIDKLIFMKVIKKDNYDGATAKDLITQINERNAETIHLFTSDRSYYDFLEQDGGDRFKNVSLWVQVSYAAFIGTRHQDLSKGGFSGKPALFLFEHGNTDSFSDVLRNHKEVPRTDLYVMGFGETVANDGEPTTCCGMFLAKESRNIDDKARIEALQTIQNPIFHQFLHGKEKLEPKECSQLVKDTGFIPCYFLHGQQAGTKLVIAACQNLFGDKKTVLVTGTFSQEELFSDENLELLKKGGFTSIEYFDASDKKATIEKNTVKKNIQTANETMPSKVLKVLSRCRLPDDEFSNLMKLITVAMGCAGDNTLQNAIERRALPLFVPHHDGKGMVLYNLALLLEKMHPEKWKECIDFLKCYKENREFGSADFRQKRYSELPKHYTPTVLSQWQEICNYLIENQNTNNLLPRIVQDKLETLDKQPSSKLT